VLVSRDSAEQRRIHGIFHPRTESGSGWITRPAAKSLTKPQVILKGCHSAERGISRPVAPAVRTPAPPSRRFLAKEARNDGPLGHVGSVSDFARALVDHRRVGNPSERVKKSRQVQRAGAMLPLPRECVLFSPNSLRGGAPLHPICRTATNSFTRSQSRWRSLEWRPLPRVFSAWERTDCSLSPPAQPRLRPY
jgi:hypothetical protein